MDNPLDSDCEQGPDRSKALRVVVLRDVSYVYETDQKVHCRWNTMLVVGSRSSLEVVDMAMVHMVVAVTSEDIFETQPT